MKNNLFITHIPYRGTGPALQDLIAGQVDMMFDTLAGASNFIKSGQRKALAVARKLGWQFDIMSTSFFVSRRSLKPAAQSGMHKWQDHLFIAMSRSANDATDYFQIPTGRVVEVGTQVTI